MIDNLTKDLQAERDRINESRLVAWCSAGNSGEIAGIEVLPLTARAWIDLRLAGNAFFVEGYPTLLDSLTYIWRNCPDYVPGEAEKRKEAITKAIEAQDPDSVAFDVFEHIQDAFTDLPEMHTGSDGGNSRSNTMEPVEGVVCAVDEVAHRYGQTPHTVMDWPLNQIFQLQRAIRIATVPDCKFREPQKIREIKSEILINLNNGKS